MKLNAWGITFIPPLLPREAAVRLSWSAGSLLLMRALRDSARDCGDLSDVVQELRIVISRLLGRGAVGRRIKPVMQLHVGYRLDPAGSDQ